MEKLSENHFDFHSENISFKLQKKPAVISWLSFSVSNELKVPGDISFIFCSDDFLHTMNQKYLDHDTLTDIITFDYCEANTINGEMFISIDRIKYNSQIFNVSFQDELHRIMIHGLMHLCGYQDKTTANQKVMKEKEDFYLNLRTF
jgi:rRNA maturation RNase YbeY